MRNTEVDLIHLQIGINAFHVGLDGNQCRHHLTITRQLNNIVHCLTSYTTTNSRIFDFTSHRIRLGAFSIFLYYLITNNNINYKFHSSGKPSK